MKKILMSLCIAVLATSCGTVTFKNSSVNILKDTPPSYEQSKNYFLGGLIGTNNINVEEVCENKTAVQFQSVKTPIDILFGVITAGIYSPKTAKVWCQ